MDHVHPPGRIDHALKISRLLQLLQAAAASHEFTSSHYRHLIWKYHVGPSRLDHRPESASHASERCASCWYHGKHFTTNFTTHKRSHINFGHLNMERRDTSCGNLSFLLVHQGALMRRLCEDSSERLGGR